MPYVTLSSYLWKSNGSQVERLECNQNANGKNEIVDAKQIDEYHTFPAEKDLWGLLVPRIADNRLEEHSEHIVYNKEKIMDEEVEIPWNL